MSETEITETTEPTVEAVEPVEPQGEKAEIDWKAEARKWENRAKSAKADSDDASKWREYEASLKPVQERLAEELETTKQEAIAAKAALLRYEIASTRGLTGDAIKLLKGTTQEELEAEAEILLSLIADQSKPKSPIPDQNQGKPADATVGQLSKEQLSGMSAQQIMEAKAAGRLNDALGIK